MVSGIFFSRVFIQSFFQSGENFFHFMFRQAVCGQLFGHKADGYNQSLRIVLYKVFQASAVQAIAFPKQPLDTVTTNGVFLIAFGGSKENGYVPRFGSKAHVPYTERISHEFFAFLKETFRFAMAYEPFTFGKFKHLFLFCPLA